MAILKQQNSRLLASGAARSLPSKRVLLPTIIMSALTLSACQTAPSTMANQGPVTSTTQTTAVADSSQPAPSYTNDGYPIQPWNINLISIDYALRPHLRSRLTPGRRTWPWESLG
ncbi:hypothetical protein, partial [uncultured Psychrobacter sp.]|uniref:hypothetical protein n=1 Tax=uncultured Psychrobacter sp. TaxID=259303 RepID=UPI002608428D